MVCVSGDGVEAHGLKEFQEAGHSVLLQHAYGRHVERALDYLVCRHGAVEGAGEVVRLEIVVVVRGVFDERGGKDEAAVQHGCVKDGLEGASAGTGGRNHVHVCAAKAWGETLVVAVIGNHISGLDAHDEDAHVVYEVAVVLGEMRAGDGVDPVLKHRVDAAYVGFVSSLCTQALKQMVGLVRHGERLFRKGFVFCEFTLDVIYDALLHQFVQ